MKFAKLTPINEALTHLLSRAKPLMGEVRVPVSQARGRVLAHPLAAPIAVPGFDNSAMDGYAFNTENLKGNEVILKVTATVAAGHPIVNLEPGTAARIFTGGVIPAGANTVVMQENVERQGELIRIKVAPVARENIRSAGHDIAKATLVLAEGKRLLPQDLGLIASLGITEIAVKPILKVAIINTGDEVVAPGNTLKSGQLYDSNSFTLAALLATLGIEVVKKGIVRDDLEATVQLLTSAAQDSDCVITTGGVSVGDADFVKSAVEKLGELSLWKLAIKPGKPFSFGHVHQKPFFGLPGNPVAVFITFITLVKPFLLAMQGAQVGTELPLKVRAGFAINESGSRQEYLRVRLRSDSNDFPVAELFTDQSSSVLTSLSWADGVVIVPIQSQVALGQLVEYLPFRGLL